MYIKSLGYVGVLATDLGEWERFAVTLLGMQAQTTAAGLTLRMDDKPHRLLVQQCDRNGAAYFGWEVSDTAALDSAGAALEAKGVKVHRALPVETEIRRVADMLWFEDPAGNRVELFHGSAKAEHPFEPPRPMSGFRTGALGLGHIVLSVTSIDTVLSFYRDVLGFRMSDYAVHPFNAVFLHVNARHHSLALIEAAQAGLHHVMLEVLALDDVGKAYDVALEQDSVSVTLGRHTNDHMLSFYARSPSRFMVEVGWGGRSIDDATWKVQEMTNGPSLWGHERSWLGEEKRAEARELRKQVAARGERAPVHVVAGEYDEVPPG